MILKEKKTGDFCRKQTAIRGWKGAVAAVGFWLAALVYWEMILHAAVFGMSDLRLGYVLGFSLGFACVLAMLTGCLIPKVNFWLMLGMSVVLTVLYGSQMVYFFVFGDLYSVAQMQQGGAAITSFWVETVTTIQNNLPWMLALLVPTAALVILRLCCRRFFVRSHPMWAAILAAAAVISTAAMIWSLPMGGTDFFSDHYFYYNANTTTDQAADRFGLLTAFRLDIFGADQVEEEDLSYLIPETASPVTESPETEPAEIDGTAPAETESMKTHNVLDIDFDKLNETTSDEKLLSLNRYFASLPGTRTNAYTGMLSDYNLIVICAEAFATGAIHEELTPTLYRMSTEGIIFNNYYNAYPNNTTDGEYTLCMGLYPDISRNKAAASFYASRNSYLPFCLGNAFLEQKGVQSYGYHNNVGDYYGRQESHPNMGYIMKFAEAGLDMGDDWPASDLEMMKQSVDDYLSRDQQFHAYYMTFSGHLLYSPEYNTMAAKNWDLVKDLEGLHELTKSYLACNIELDRALEYLMNRLEEAGVADKTAIVLAGDHFPYGLNDYTYSQLLEQPVDSFTRYRSSLLFWVGGLEENIIVDEYCCNADILPTVLNLWGFDFDSRLLMGTDVFSDGVHVAVLRDTSFFTDKVWMNVSTGKLEYLVDPGELPENYVQDMLKLVQRKYALSADILNKAYYNYIFSKESVLVGREVWGEDPDAQ